MQVNPTHLVGEGVKVPLPAELSVNISFASQALASLDNFQIGNVEFRVFDLKFLWCNHDSFLEE